MIKDIEHKIPAYSDILHDVLSFAGGMNSRSSELFLERGAKFSLAKDQARLLINLIRTQSGLLTTRPGREKLNLAALTPADGDATIRSIFELKPADGNNSVLVNAGASIYKYVAGDFIEQTTVATENLRMHWCQFKDYALGINGADAMVRHNGSSSDTIAGAPVNGSAIAAHRNRVWVLVGRTLKYCALGDETDWTTPNNAGSLPVPTTKGVGGTGLISLWERLIITTGDQVFQLFGTSPADFEMVPISLSYGHAGAPTALLAAGNEIYYCSKRGVHALSMALSQSDTADVTYNYASAIVEPTWHELNVGNIPNIVGVHDSMNNLVIFLGNRTGALNNEAFVADYYHLDDAGMPTWSLYGNMPFASAAEVSSINNKPEVLFGSYDGFVYRQTDVETDDGASIPTQLVYKTDLELPAFSKLWRHLLLFAAGQDTTLSGNITYDFGLDSIPLSANLHSAGGDTIGGTFTIGTSVLGISSLKEIRIPIPSHGRFATINMHTNSHHRVIIGGFVIYAGVRRTIHH